MNNFNFLSINIKKKMKNICVIKGKIFDLFIKKTQWKDYFKVTGNFEILTVHKATITALFTVFMSQW